MLLHDKAPSQEPPLRLLSRLLIQDISSCCPWLEVACSLCNPRTGQAMTKKRVLLQWPLAF